MITEQNAKFKGVFTALTTPMDEEGKLDLVSLERLAEHQIEQGVTGFYVGGSTAEGFILTSEERMQILETVVRKASSRVTVIAHVGCISTNESIMLARHAESAGADAISAVVPFYYSVGEKEIEEHYCSIMSAVDLPFIMYYYPSATGVQLPFDFYERMAAHPKCIGVKFTSQQLFEMQQIRVRCGKYFLIFNGYDEVYSGGAMLGADAAIGSTFNIMPALFSDIYRSIEAEDWNAVREKQNEANQVIAHMLNFDVIPYEKYILYLQGVIRTPKVRQPLKQYTEEERQAIETFYKHSQTLQRSKFSVKAD